jgi:hypothetical protein
MEGTLDQFRTLGGNHVAEQSGVAVHVASQGMDIPGGQWNIAATERGVSLPFSG